MSMRKYLLPALCLIGGCWAAYAAYHAHGVDRRFLIVCAIVALIAGILILIMPRLLNFIVAIYLICVGLIGLGALRFLHL